MTVTVPVNATWRMGRAEIDTPYGPNQTISGYGEVLLQEAPDAPPEASILRRRNADDSTTYGALPSDTIRRYITAELLTEKVTVDGTTVDLKSVLQALEQFFDRWRIEDAAAPPLPPPPTLPEPLPSPPLPDLPLPLPPVTDPPITTP